MSYSLPYPASDPKNGYFRVASCIPKVSVANVTENIENIKQILTELNDKGVELAVFPEMCLTGYTCADLFHNRTLLDEAAYGIAVLALSMPFDGVAIVGAPLEYAGVIYNCAFVIGCGRVLGAVPKTYIPNYNEFYEKRWWKSANDIDAEIEMDGCKFRLSTNQLFQVNGATVGIEICEDLWTPMPPSSRLALAGAQVIVNLSASDDLIGKYDYLKSLISQQSARCLSAYVYSSAGFGESSTDLVFDGKAIIAENGKILAINKRWQNTAQTVVADIDLEALNRDRIHNGSFGDCQAREIKIGDFKTEKVELPGKNDSINQLYREIDPQPFVPATDYAMAQRCDEIINIQAAGLAKRLDAIKCRSLVVGISGGLDSTLALLVAVKAFDRLSIDRKGILGITMPGFGTTARTKGNAVKLMEELGVSIEEIPIGDAVIQHFKDIKHDPTKQDVTYENSQARERTQILMDMANKTGGIVLGTGDLSELALGWATYNGDHMSMYGVNTGVPKTLVKYLVRYFAQEEGFESCKATLLDIIDTPISPELIPADSDDNIVQKTEDLVGPYELHDFFLYYTLRFGFTPHRIYFMAQHAFDGRYDNATILKWMHVFFRRFFQQQFKRSCLPDGPKVGSVCLSPRGDWRMPSDASSFLWLQEIEALEKDANKSTTNNLG